MSGIEYLGDPRGDGGSIYRSGLGTLYRVTDESPCEDWLLVAAREGVASRRRLALEHCARRYACTVGTIVLRYLGVTDERRVEERDKVYAESWTGTTDRLCTPEFRATGEAYRSLHSAHAFVRRVDEDYVWVADRGRVLVPRIELQLLPSRIRLGRLLVG